MVVQVGLKSSVGMLPLRDFRQNLFTRVPLCPSTRSDAFERQNGRDKLADWNVTRLCQNIENPGPRDDRSPLDLSERYAREPYLRSKASGVNRPASRSRAAFVAIQVRLEAIIFLCCRDLSFQRKTITRPRWKECS